ncbi:hypothetical protein [Naasia lichenicola]|uniref:Phosphotransferase system EIIB component type 2/3 domain-containing protein n=1 Tax=Naasia lichenicola TaxID=2565933 RepID=A0A4S4FKM9_9MICO|nr:hypothetical protein [Naasia lichenicola]THG29726.1 hypothetical protein E6C64_13745 [Naasia lichenicola]
MATVLLVCVAGVSGTFLAKRMRRLDPSLDTVVADYAGLADVIHGADVVLIAPQLADVDRSIGDLAPGVPSAILPASAFSAGGAEIALRTVHELLGATADPLAPARPTPAYPGASA